MNRPKEQRNLQRLRFLTSSVNMQGCPADEFPEVALVGRSNSGKSSLINGLAGSRIAQVSATPGKTRLLNFYEAPGYRLVDMPGYGFSARSGAEQSGWQQMIEPYLAARGNLVGLLIVMDVRRDWTSDEEDLIRWLRPRELPAAIIVTKVDKLSRSKMLERIRAIARQSKIETVLPTSTLNRQGFVEVEEFFFQSWVKPVKENLQ